MKFYRIRLDMTSQVLFDFETENEIEIQLNMARHGKSGSVEVTHNCTTLKTTEFFSVIEIDFNKLKFCWMR